MPAKSGPNLWCGREFRIQNIEKLSESDVIQYTFLPCEPKEGMTWFKRVFPDTPVDTNGEKTTFECSGADLWPKIKRVRAQVRVQLDCEHGNKRIYVRWNSAKKRWSGFQKGWDLKVDYRLFVIPEKRLISLISNGGGWQFPGKGKPEYCEAVDGSTAIDAKGFCEVAAVLDHKIDEKSGKISYLVRWEDFDNNHHRLSKKNDNSWKTEKDFDKNDAALDSYKKKINLN